LGNARACQSHEHLEPQDLTEPKIQSIVIRSFFLNIDEEEKVITVLAFDPNDGYAFFVEDGQFYHVRPPFQAFDLVERDISNRLIRQLDYQAGRPEDTFTNRDALVAWMRAHLEQRASRSTPRTPEELFAALLPYTEPHTISHYLDRIERELLPRRECKIASRMVDLIATQQARLPLDFTRRMDELRTRIQQSASGDTPTA
jgi:hypothetical protein